MSQSAVSYLHQSLNFLLTLGALKVIIVIFTLLVIFRASRRRLHPTCTLIHAADTHDVDPGDALESGSTTSFRMSLLLHKPSFHTLETSGPLLSLDACRRVYLLLIFFRLQIACFLVLFQAKSGSEDHGDPDTHVLGFDKSLQTHSDGRSDMGRSQ